LYLTQCLRQNPNPSNRMKLFLSLTTLAVYSLMSLAATAADLKIVAAENFYGGVAQQIAGSDATVTSILTNPNQDPHEFTSNAATAKSVADADIVIYNGLSYDPWMEKLLASGGKPNRVVIKVADLIEAKEGDNPHIWYDIQTMSTLTGKLFEEFSKLDPVHADIYQKRQIAFDASLKPLIDKIMQIRATMRGDEVTATEPVFGYMATALGFKMLNYDFQVKIMNDAEPTADQTAAFEKSLTSKRALILFYNSQVNDPITDRLQKIAQKSGIPIVGVTETQPPNQKSYVDWMIYQLDQVQVALAYKKP